VGQPDPKVPLGTQGPWPTANAIYDGSSGIQESPVVAVTTDEAQNRWVATNSALYLFTPGATSPKRFTSKDGLHLMDNPESYCETVTGYSFGSWSSSLARGWDGTSCTDFSNYPCFPVAYPACPVTGAAVAPGISTIAGGAPNEVFVGYFGELYDSGPNHLEGDKDDPGRHTGKVDWVKLQPDGTIQVTRLDLASVAHGMIYWHNRTVYRLVYDHVIHPASLYVGTNHGVDYLRMDKWRPQATNTSGQFTEWVDSWLQEWMGDHLHAEAHSMCGTTLCTGETGLLLGDWKGLAIDANGDLWHAGKWAAGRIAWDPSPLDWIVPPAGVQRITVQFSSDIGNSVFSPPANVVDGIDLKAVTVTSDGRVWFGSSKGYGLASWKKGEPFSYYDSSSLLGFPDGAIADLVALPDGRLAVAHPSAGVALWNPATGDVKRLRGGSGIPSDQVISLEVDAMVSPPSLHVATRGGGAVLRVLP
jgi:hypothetical protein